MPSSTSAGKPYIKGVINNMINKQDFRILDLGCGRGTYARLIEKPCYKVGVDACDYEERFGLHNFYDEFHVRDIRDTTFLKSLGHFDLVIAGDVLEHLYYEETRCVLNAMEEIGEACIIALPYIYPQKAFGKGDWEEHKQDDLTREIIKKRYPELVLLKEYTRKAQPWNGGVFYGYYAWFKKLEKEGG